MTHDAHPKYSLRTRLHQEGFRVTYQRQLILDLFKTSAASHHLSAEEIYNQLSQQGSGISLSTIYRSLRVMVKLGLLRELELADDKKYYELTSAFPHQHHHLVCVQCGAVQEFEADMIPKIGANQSEVRGYALLDFQFTIYGICSHCQRG